MPPCCHWLIVALDFVSPVIHCSCCKQSLHCTTALLAMMQSPLLLLASPPSLVCVAVAATARRAAPLYCQCWPTSIIATVVPWPLSLLASLLQWYQFWSLAFFSSCYFFRPLSLRLDCAAVLAMLMAYLLSPPVDCHLLHCQPQSLLPSLSPLASLWWKLAQPPLLLATASCCLLLPVCLLQYADVCRHTVSIDVNSAAPFKMGIVASFYHTWYLGHS